MTRYEGVAPAGDTATSPTVQYLTDGDLPAIAVPSGVDDRGRPLSIMFVGGLGAETQLLRIALAVERTGLGTTPV